MTDHSAAGDLAGLRPAGAEAGQKLNGYQERTPGAAITVDAAKGLSKLQRNILGLAYTVREYRRRDVGVPIDYRTPLGIFAIYGLAPDIAQEHSSFRRTPRVARAQAALSRAATRLVERKLLMHHDASYSVNGYNLTESGRLVGAQHPVVVPMIERCVRFFGMTTLCRWLRDEAGIWRRDDWLDGNGNGYGYKVVDDDFDALRTIQVEAAA